MRRSVVVGLLLLLLLAACTDARQFVRSKPDFQPTAAANYDAGLAASKAGNYLLAQQYFEYIRTHFAFTKWAANAELATIDIEGGRQHWLEAIDLYQHYLRTHPTHERVLDGYVAFKICEAITKQMPTRSFLAPPVAEQEQTPSNDAYRALTEFFAAHPDSPYGVEARALWQNVVKQLTDHELYVASYYLKNDKPRAAAWRIEGVLTNFAGCAREAEAMLLLGEIYLQRLSDPQRAKLVFEQVVLRHADDMRATKAKLYLVQIAKQYPG